MEKVCCECAEVKPPSAFSRDAHKADGLRSRCRECAHEYLSAYFSDEDRRLHRNALAAKYWRSKHPAAKIRLTPEEAAARRKRRYHEWYEKNREYKRAYARERAKSIPHTYTGVDREKLRARRTLQAAVREGRISKPTSCPLCGAAAILHGHHADYSKPLEVAWMCSTCHGKQHRT